MLQKPLRTEEMNIFFDESGDDSNRPATMGGLLVPDSVYSSPAFQELTRMLQNKDISLHWTKYTGQKFLGENIRQVMFTFSKYARYSRMNIISYNRNILDQRYKFSNDHGARKLSKKEKKHVLDYATLMVYTKIPERIFYGLLRHYGKDLYIKTKIFIEKEGKYKKYELERRLTENLNTQSLYRAEQYWVDDCKMETKGKMIGIELVDLLLGIIRLILSNQNVQHGLTDEEYKNRGILSLSKKHKLAIELMKIPEFYTFLSNISYYEWDSNKSLSEVPFKDYLDLFMASNYEYLDNQ
ncbi:DUF3800 domain-containing protein [Rossellomorea aquimaris]|uniref:Uncharacterized protein DUF3800 n=1 Tax=Rossellomorea aquimaris TaxID=189382 RepID=A0A366ED49_9BACI|nr:DUF3800 domain-containing protein [Rossellomorea aquimaris]RBO99985.1 uncharacterized protein DUF3800 [Rossellomorea aquimaris]